MLVQRSEPGLVIWESDLFRTVTTLIIGSDHLLLVDPNWLPREVEFIAAEVERLRGKRKLYLLFTHSDYDHIIGCGRFPGAETIASAAFTNNPEREKILTQIRDFDDAYYLRRTYPIVYPEITHKVGNQLQRLTLGGESYVFFPAPGHNRDGIITLLEKTGILIVGDYLSNIEFPYLYHSVGGYRGTLDRLESLIAGGGVRTLITGHGDATDDRTEMKRRLADSRAYLDELERCVRRGEAFDTARLYARYGFPKVMAEFHSGNAKLMREHIKGAGAGAE